MCSFFSVSHRLSNHSYSLEYYHIAQLDLVNFMHHWAGRCLTILTHVGGILSSLTEHCEGFVVMYFKPKFAFEYPFPTLGGNSSSFNAT